MTRLGRWLARAREFEARLARAADGAARTLAPPGAAAPLEIVRRAVEEIARHVHPSGRGRRAVAFNDVTVMFVAPAGARAPFEALAAGPPTLRDRVVDRLTEAGCDAGDVEVAVAFAEAPDPDWPRADFHVVLARIDPATRPAREAALRLDLVVTHGAADRGAYVFTTLPIAIGRGADVRDERQRLVRVNHVAFTEGGDEAAGSVSRRHARIDLDPRARRPRLLDENSTQGTSIIRAGRSLVVPRGSRGMGLQDGDEIVLGQARLRVRLTTDN
jgi:hypothetical protein